MPLQSRVSALKLYLDSRMPHVLMSFVNYAEKRENAFPLFAVKCLRFEQGLSDRRTASVTQREETGQRYRLCVEYLEAQESYNEQLRKRDGRRPRVGEFGPSDERWPWYSELLGREMKISEVQKEMATHAESSGRAFPDTEDDSRQWLDTNEGRQAKDCFSERSNFRD